jgi:hypothetical protein
LEDEVIRNQIVSLIFETVANIEPTFADYEHLLGEGRQLLDSHGNDMH